MKLIDIKTAIVDKLKAYIPTVNVVANEVKEGFNKPAFFIQMIPFGITTINKYHRAKGIAIDIHYFSDVKTHIDNLKMIDSLADLFLPVLNVLDRSFTVENVETEEIEGILHFKFDINFIDSIDVTEEEYELMQELQLKEEY